MYRKLYFKIHSGHKIFFLKHIQLHTITLRVRSHTLIAIISKSQILNFKIYLLLHFEIAIIQARNNIF